MKNLHKLIFFTGLVSIIFFGCKKYPEGGLHMCAYKHLITDGNSCWKLTVYEVNGSDSTHLISASADPHYYSCTLIIERANKSKKEFYVTNSQYNYFASLESDKSLLKFKLTNKTSFQTGDVREIINPENMEEPIWVIEKLKKNELVLTATFTNSYVLKFEKK
jgi:hypothetical protein